MMGRPQTHVANPESHQADFRSLSPAGPLQMSGAAPQTGLGILMNNKNGGGAQPANNSAVGYSMASMTPEQRRMVQDDLADRELQASALAAAGMVAETVNHTTVGVGPNGIQGLHAPPMLGSLAPPPNADPGSTIEGINWSLMDLGPALDDMEMDFAKLFDPAAEEANMQTEGSGWPGAHDPAQAPPQGNLANTTT
jgi:hypothetical protein